MMTNTHAKLLTLGFEHFADEKVYVKTYVVPVIGIYGNHGLSCQIGEDGCVEIQVFAPSGRIVDDINNMSGVDFVDTPEDAVRLNTWIEEIKNEVV